MANEKILLKAEAAQLGIEGYRTMSLEDLKHAVKTAKTGSSPKGKGKSASTNGAAPAKGKTSTPAKGKGKGKTTPAKSKTQKSGPAKGKAATGTAKRSPTANSTKGKGTASKAKGSTKAPAKAKTAKPAARRSRKPQTGRVSIDRTQIDWRLETNVGLPGSGKRELVMDALRKHRGNYDKCFETLKGYAKKWYPQHDKHTAEKSVRWLINRVAYDYVMNTEQHEPGDRDAYGTSDNPTNVARRERRAKEARARKRKR